MIFFYVGTRQSIYAKASVYLVFFVLCCCVPTRGTVAELNRPFVHRQVYFYVTRLFGWLVLFISYSNKDKERTCGNWPGCG